MLVNRSKHVVVMQNTTPVHVAQDNDTVFDKFQWATPFFIPATTLSGLFRNFVKGEAPRNPAARLALLLVFQESFLANKGAKEQRIVEQGLIELYKNQGFLKFTDATLRTKNAKVLMRDHLLMSRTHQAAQKNALFQDLLLDIGNAFQFEIEVDQWSDDLFDGCTENICALTNEERFLRRALKSTEDVATARNKLSRQDVESALIALSGRDTLDGAAVFSAIETLVEQFVAHIHQGNIRFCGKTTFDYGRFDITSYAHKSFAFPKDLETYLGWSGESEAYQPIEKLVKKHGIKPAFVDIGFAVRCDEGFFIGQYSEMTNQQTSFSESHYKGESQEIIVPSSTVKGMVRAHFEKIAHTIDRMNSRDAISTEERDKVAEMFGYTQEYLNRTGQHWRMESAEATRNERENAAQALDKKGDLIFSDVILRGEHAIKCLESHEKTQIKIDRFTGGAYRGALRTYQWVVPNQPFKLSIAYNKQSKLSEDIERYMAWFKKDIADGLVTMGALGSVGAGLLKIEEETHA